MILGLALSPGIRQPSRDCKSNHRELRLLGGGNGSEFSVGSRDTLELYFGYLGLSLAPDGVYFIVNVRSDS